MNGPPEVEVMGGPPGDAFCWWCGGAFRGRRLALPLRLDLTGVSRDFHRDCAGELAIEVTDLIIAADLQKSDDSPADPS